jgi:hypothetical protein
MRTVPAALIFPVMPIPENMGSRPARLGTSDLTLAGLKAGHSAVRFPVAVTVMPEPSTCAALAGVFALGLAVWRRRTLA